MSLILDETAYRLLTVDGVPVRAWEGIPYCEHPLSPVERLNLYAPEAYFHGGSVGRYTSRTAPIFCPNTVGGYMEGPAMEPDGPRFGPDVLSAALKHGYVAACPGIRGRNSENGRAPALIVDMKAAVRFLRYNGKRIPGDTDRIVTSGTSAGGALSALAGATGNHPDYEPYLKEIGAAQERDDVFAANCYCPIHNLENADAAYEWTFGRETEYRRMRILHTDRGIERRQEDCVLTPEQKEVSAALGKLFPAYVNSLGLEDGNGAPLTLADNGEGSFLEYAASEVVRSARLEEETGASERTGMMAARVRDCGFLIRRNGRIEGIDWPSYVHAIGRMKVPPAFDALDLSSPENDEFGGKHFTAFSSAREGSGDADGALVRMLNPTLYIGEADTAPHWRIRHGTWDRDTSPAIPLILSLLLKKKGYDVDFLLPWGLPHSGDYDLDELFAWIDGLCDPGERTGTQSDGGGMRI